MITWNVFCRHEYVEAYVDYIFNKSIKEPFSAFYDGFQRVCDGLVLVSQIMLPYFY